MRGFGRHLGSRVSALIDGQMAEDEADRAWRHVGACPFCRDAVERESWVKNTLALGVRDDPPPTTLAGSLEGLPYAVGSASGVPQEDLLPGAHSRGRRTGLVLVGVGSVSVALVGMATVGVTPGFSGPAGGPAETSIGNAVTREASPTPRP